MRHIDFAKHVYRNISLNKNIIPKNKIDNTIFIACGNDDILVNGDAIERYLIKIKGEEYVKTNLLNMNKIFHTQIITNSDYLFEILTKFGIIDESKLN